MWHFQEIHLSNIFREEALRHKSDRLSGNVVLIQPSFVKQFTILVILIVVTSTTYLLFAKFNRSVEAKGYLSPQKNVHYVKATKSGEVSGLSIKDGMYVNKGEMVGHIQQSLSTDSGVEVGNFKIEQISEQINALQKDLDRADENYAFNLQKLKLESGSYTEQQNLIRLKNDKLDQRIKLNKTTVEQISTLSNKGFVSKLEINNKLDNILSLEQEQLSYQEQLTNIRDLLNINAQEQKILQIDYQNNKSAINRKLSSLLIQRAETQETRTTTLVIPHSGVVGSVSVSEGQQVDEGQRILSVLPINEDFYAYLFLPSDSASQITTGLSVNLKYAAFPYERFGVYRGEVVQVSTDAVTPDQFFMKNTEAMYRVIVKLPNQEVLAYGKKTPLKLGMTVSAEIIVETMTFWEWLFEPFYAMNKDIIG